MTPIKMFEGWADWKFWGLGLALSFSYGDPRLYVQLGPFQGAINFTGEPNWKV